MLNSLLDDSKKQLSSALKHKKHPFRYCTLATISLDGTPHLRTVVLRAFDETKFLITLFTDTRSDKIKELANDPRAEFLFYDTHQFLQLRIKVELYETSNAIEQYTQLPEPSKKDYSCVFAPGEPILSPELIRHDYEKGHFTKLVFKAYELEYLKLKRPNHLRAIFLSSEDWKGSFIAP